MAHHDMTDMGEQVVEQLPRVSGLDSLLREGIPRLVYVSNLGWKYYSAVLVSAICAALLVFGATSPTSNTSYFRVALDAPLPWECHWREQQSVTDAVTLLSSTLAVSNDMQLRTWRHIPVETWLDVDVQSPLVIVRERFRPITLLGRASVGLSRLNPFAAKLALDGVASPLESRIKLSDLVGPCVTILDLPSSPAFTASSKEFLPLYMAGGIAILMVIPLILVRFIELSYLRIYSREILSDKDVQEIGEIPYFDDFSRLTRKISRNNGPSVDPVNHIDLYRETMTSLAAEVSEAMLESPSNAILVTSITPGVGKSAIARGLAYAFQRSGKRSLLIDADLRLGRQHPYIGVDRAPGVSDIIAGASTLEAGIRNADSWTELPFLSCGTLPPNPSELLMHEKLRGIIDEATKNFDRVIVDLPPAVVADPWIVAKIPSLILLVVPRQIRVMDKAMYLGKIRQLKKRKNPLALVTSSAGYADWDDRIPSDRFY